MNKETMSTNDYFGPLSIIRESSPEGTSKGRGRDRPMFGGAWSENQVGLVKK